MDHTDNTTARKRLALGLSTAQLTQWLLLIVLTLSVGNAIVIYAKHVLGTENILIVLFDMDHERNIPTLYSSALLLLSALLLAIVHYINKNHPHYHDKLPPTRDHNYWLFLSFLFVCMSIDESFSFHERLIGPVRSIIGTHQWLYFAWIVPAGLFLMVLAIWLFNFLMRLPAATRFRFLLAGFIYIGGAVGIEILGGYHAFVSMNTLSYDLTVMVEETLEMIGLIMFIRAILLHIHRFLGSQFTFNLIVKE